MTTHMSQLETKFPDQESALHLRECQYDVPSSRIATEKSAQKRYDSSFAHEKAPSEKTDI